MPKARVIVRDRERAQKTVASLHASGYEVDLAAPDDPQVGDYDLVIDLEQLPEVESSTYSLDEAAGYFVEGEQPSKREFIFAPVWRKVTEFVRHWFQSWQQRRAATREAPVEMPAHEPTPVMPLQPQIDHERIAAAFRAQRTELEAAFTAQLEQIKAERRAQGSEILQLQQELAALRQQNEFLAQSQVQPEAEKQMDVSTSVPAPVTATPDRVSELQIQLGRYAQRAKGLLNESSRQAGKAAVVAASSIRDVTVRPSFSVAAGILFAFLLGFWAATGKRTPESRPVVPAVEANVSSATVVPASAPAKSPAPPAATTAKIPKPSPVKQAAVQEDEGDFQEVVTRHYPNRGAIAKTEPPNKVKQYSDIEDQQ